MITYLLSFPPLLGGFVFTVLTAAVGLVVYLLVFNLITKRQPAEVVAESKSVTSNLIRVVGWLFCLLLSMTFTELVRELNDLDNAIEGEATAIASAHLNLGRFGTDEAHSIQTLLADYTEAVIQDDWPALALDQTAKRPRSLLRQLEDAVLNIKVTSPVQEILRSRIIDDVEVITDHRLSRVQQARETAPFTISVVFFGYLVTMAPFGLYRPYASIVGLMSLYAVFVGVVTYLMLALSAPFTRATPVNPEPLEFVLQAMRTQIG
jgi:hypothetical protein